METFGNVTLEALSSGCPCVVEKKCGEHLVDYGVNGLTCAAGNFEEFYQATRRLVVDHQLRAQMSSNARKSARKFERNIILQQMAENYKVVPSWEVLLLSVTVNTRFLLSFVKPIVVWIVLARVGCHREAPRPVLLEEAHGHPRGPRL